MNNQFLWEWKNFLRDERDFFSVVSKFWLKSKPMFQRESSDTPHRTFQTHLGTVTNSPYNEKFKTNYRGEFFEGICRWWDCWPVSPPSAQAKWGRNWRAPVCCRWTQSYSPVCVAQLWKLVDPGLTGEQECLEEFDLSTLLWTAEKLLSECCLERSGGGKLAEIAPNARVGRCRCSGCTSQFHHLFSGYRRKQKKVMGFELSTKGFILKGTPEERGPVECFTISWELR